MTTSTTGARRPRDRASHDPTIPRTRHSWELPRSSSTVVPASGKTTLVARCRRRRTCSWVSWSYRVVRPRPRPHCRSPDSATSWNRSSTASFRDCRSHSEGPSTSRSSARHPADSPIEQRTVAAATLECHAACSRRTTPCSWRSTMCSGSIRRPCPRWPSRSGRLEDHPDPARGGDPDRARRTARPADRARSVAICVRKRSRLRRCPRRTSASVLMHHLAVTIPRPRLETLARLSGGNPDVRPRARSARDPAPVRSRSPSGMP